MVAETAVEDTAVDLIDRSVGNNSFFVRKQKKPRGNSRFFMEILVDIDEELHVDHVLKMIG